MSNRRSAWIDRRGQRGADAAIDQVIERQPQAGEHVQQLADELIEDSPYQARQAFSKESIEELAQGMREAGFQGVLIVRPHSDPTKRRRGMVQLVYGHRRHMAWRQVCAERGAACLVPVVVREIDDAQLLTIGAQENLQRQDLDPLEEAQIVVWLERMFFEKNQTEIGAMLGKSSDWVSVRSRVYKLPDVLKERLRQRPRAIGQMLELGLFYAQQPAMAVLLANRVVNENLTVTAVRKLIRDAMQPAPAVEIDREGTHNYRANATFVQDITNDPHPAHHAASITDESRTSLGADNQFSERTAETHPGKRTWHANQSGQLNKQRSLDATSTDAATAFTNDLTLLKEVADALTLLASHADELPLDAMSEQALDQIATALEELRRSFARHTSDAQIDIANAD